MSVKKNKTNKKKRKPKAVDVTVHTLARRAEKELALSKDLTAGHIMLAEEVPTPCAGLSWPASFGVAFIVLLTAFVIGVQVGIHHALPAMPLVP
jgi:hypothetical protein